MRHTGVLLQAAALCLIVALESHGQAQGPGTARPLLRPFEPDSPTIGTTVAAGPQAVVPRLIKVTGTLHDAAGKPLSGTVDVTFTLYATEAGENPLWFETQSVQADELGHYAALLGAMHTDGLPIELFTTGEVRWLGVQVGLEAEQQPRVLLVSGPCALKAGDAETLGGKPGSAYMLSDSQNGTASTTFADALAKPELRGGGPQPNVSGTGTTNLLAKWTNTSGALGNSMIFDTGTYVGVGTTSPSYALDVNGNNAGLRLAGTGTHQLTLTGATPAETAAAPPPPLPP